MTIQTPFVSMAPSDLKPRIQAVKSAIKKHLNTGCSTANAYEISAAVAGLKDYNTLSGLMSGDFYEVGLGNALNNGMAMKAPLGFFETVEDATSELISQCNNETISSNQKDNGYILYKNGSAVSVGMPTDSKPSAMFVYVDGPDNIIGDVRIDSVVFSDEMINWKFEDREELIDSIYDLIGGCDRSPAGLANRQMMISDVEYLSDFEDDVILSSILSNEYIIPSIDPEQFNEICTEILEIHKSLQS